MAAICSVPVAIKGIFMHQRIGIAAENAVNLLAFCPALGYQE